MSQCCVWGCHNRKGRYIKDIDGKQLCGSLTLQMQHCPICDILLLTCCILLSVCHSMLSEQLFRKSISWGKDPKELLLGKVLFAMCIIQILRVQPRITKMLFQWISRDQGTTLKISPAIKRKTLSKNSIPKTKRLSKKSVAALPFHHVDVTNPPTDDLSNAELVCSHIDSGEQELSSDLSSSETSQQDTYSCHY